MSAGDWIGVVGGCIGFASGPVNAVLALRVRRLAAAAEASRVRAEASAREARGGVR